MRINTLLLLVCCSFAIAGCGPSGEDELRVWMAEQRASTKPSVQPLTMVGSLNKSGAPTALIKIDNLIYQVKVGSYLGQNYGKVMRIAENSIQLREIAQDATGDWIERFSTLDLQEGKK